MKNDSYRLQNQLLRILFIAGGQTAEDQAVMFERLERNIKEPIDPLVQTPGTDVPLNSCGQSDKPCVVDKPAVASRVVSETIANVPEQRSPFGEPAKDVRSGGTWSLVEVSTREEAKRSGDKMLAGKHTVKVHKS